MSDNYSRDGNSPNAMYVFHIVEFCGHCWDVEGTSLLSLIKYISGLTPHIISISVIFWFWSNMLYRIICVKRESYTCKHFGIVNVY